MCCTNPWMPSARLAMACVACRPPPPSSDGGGELVERPRQFRAPEPPVAAGMPRATSMAGSSTRMGGEVILKLGEEAVLCLACLQIVETDDQRRSRGRTCERRKGDADTRSAARTASSSIRRREPPHRPPGGSGPQCSAPTAPHGPRSAPRMFRAGRAGSADPRD